MGPFATPGSRRKGGAKAIKVEGDEHRIELIFKLVVAEIPVMGHIGLTPQSFHVMGGSQGQGKTVEAGR
ncbi:MAG TPA: 3-methyl-2-oxobutanoate hydroxymethyltransferase [Candidatus Acidoferrales bacterium]|nr:3-methyl-2-oxobutanoate hydroxymethyltransferase [Candidatus Acidoferrales bacterium]